MASPSVTYTFVNGQASDGSQVNTNFNDILNALTDGTKTINVAAITAGTAALSTSVTAPSATITNLSATNYAQINYVYSLQTNTDYVGLTNDGFRFIGFSTGNTNRAYTLPAAASSTNRIITIKKTDTGTGIVTISDGTLTVRLPYQNDSVEILSDGTAWTAVGFCMGTDYLEGVNSAGTSMSNNTLTNLTSVTVGAGKWVLTAAFNIGATITTGSQFQAGISTANNSYSGQNYDGSTTILDFDPASKSFAMPVIGIRVAPTSATTYYLNATAVFSGGTATGRGIIQAHRKSIA